MLPCMASSNVKPTAAGGSGTKRGARGCTAQNRAGKLCDAPAVQGSSHCQFHTPGRASDAGKIGGPRRKIFDPAKLTPIAAPDTAQELKKILAALMVDLHGARLDSKTANALAVLGQVFLQALQHGDWEERLKALEANAQAMKAAKDGRR
jgi:hypothetical protein